MTIKASPKVLRYESHNSFGMHDDTISIHLGQLGVSSPVIPGLFPDGFQIEVTIKNGTPALINRGTFPLVVYKNTGEGGMETNVISQDDSIQFKIDEYFRFAVTVFSPSGNPLTLDVNLKVWAVVNTNGYDHALNITPRIV